MIRAHCMTRAAGFDALMNSAISLLLPARLMAALIEKEEGRL